MKRAAAKNIDEYIESFPDNVRKVLQKIRKTIQKAAPHAEETISYAIPTFKLNGNLIYFAGYQNHVSVYPRPRGVKEFEKDLAQHEGGKGTIRFPLDAVIPYELIARVTTYRVQQNMEQASAKAAKKKSGAKKSLKKSVKKSSAANKAGGKKRATAKKR